ncbi:hypothetical protein DSUL_40052 [Desulfovibrionales bacterium]
MSCSGSLRILALTFFGAYRYSFVAEYSWWLVFGFLLWL